MEYICVKSCTIAFDQWLWTKNVLEVRHHAGQPQRVTVLHERGCKDIGESGLEPVLAVALPEDWLSGSLCMRPRSMPMLIIDIHCSLTQMAVLAVASLVHICGEGQA